MRGVDTEAPEFPEACTGQRWAAAAGAVQPAGSESSFGWLVRRGEEEKVRKGTVRESELLGRRWGWGPLLGSAPPRGEIERQSLAR